METIPVWLVIVAIGFWKLRKQNEKRNEKLGELVKASKMIANPRPKKLIVRKKLTKLVLKPSSRKVRYN